MRKIMLQTGTWFALLWLAAFAAASAHAAVEGHFDRTLTVTGPVSLDVSTGSGNINVQPGEAGKVEIHARIHAHAGWGSGDAEKRVQYLEQHPPIEQDGNAIRVGHVNDRHLLRNISISYEITTPPRTSLHAASGSGNQTVQGLNGTVDATSGSGDLRLSNIGQQVSARTGSGEVTLSRVHGSVRAGTGSGDIRADGISGGMNASTGSGNVTMTQTGSGDVQVSTGSGTVELHGVKGALRAGTGSGNIFAQGTPAGDWRMRTGSGDLTVQLPQGSSFELYAHTSSGSIQSAFRIAVQGTISPRALHGQVGSGGPTVDLSTSSGTIHLESQ